MEELLKRLIDSFSNANLNLFIRRKITSYKETHEDYNHFFSNDQDICAKFNNIEIQGEATLNQIEDLLVITAHSLQDLTDRSGKKLQFEIAKEIIKQKQADSAIFVFYDDNGSFRFSFIRVNYIGSRKDFTDFKRYTYYVSKDLTNKTFISQMCKTPFTSLDVIQEAFSVEPLTKDFYSKLQNWYFWDIETTGQTTSAGGTGKSTAEMQTLSTYLEAGWDFVGETENGTEDIWTFVANDYPHLFNEGYAQQLSTPPVNLRANIGLESVNLVWSLPLPGTRAIIGYNVYRYNEQINDTMLLEKHYEDTNLTSGESYSYFVTAVYDEEESEPSNTIEILVFDVVATLPNPDNFEIVVEGHSIQLSWNEITGDFDQNPLSQVLYIMSFNDVNPSIEGNFYYLDYTTELSYTDVNVGASDKFMFYQVRAYLDVDNRLLNSINELVAQKQKVSLKEIEGLIKNSNSKPISRSKKN